MTRLRLQPLRRLAKTRAFRITLYLVVILLTSNLNAMVCHFLHPEIPYFDKEHVIVGGVTGIVCAVLFGLVALYVRHLNRALKRIRVLEAVLPICVKCKRIRKPDSDPMRMESWEAIESYITQKADTEFTHGICPDCAAKLYPDLV